MSDDFRIDIDLDHIQDGIKVLKKLRNQIESAIEDGIDETVERMKARIQSELDSMGLGGTRLAHSVNVEYLGDEIIITVDQDYGEYVEFGTGIVGEQNPHPTPWLYDVNGHGEKGWVYKDERGYHRTKGQPARPFMYNTYRYGRNILTKTVRKHLRNIR